MTTSPARADTDRPTDSSTGGARRGRPGYDRDKLIAVCVQVFNKHGYDTTSMGTLSSHLGISKSAIYHHVNSKEEILEEALLRALDSLESAIDDVLAADAPAIETLEGVIRRTVRVLVDQMPYVTLLLRLRGNSEVELAALERRRRITRAVEGLVRAAQDEGSLRTDISGKSAPRLMLGMINSIVDWYHPEGQGTVEQVADTAVKMVLDGLRV
ncbi:MULTISPECIES: TetR/AcrR family transcriptional regulator [Kocuria]|uniref:TetR/AcrR family transcriptional regulator n=1 Tax=Kocuria TaxID=57493 RepID=UPI0009E2CE17|nr:MULTISPECIES: TetR/AcrR family transcriptional regulator [Kocuria]MCT1368153.1 TetR/AcrR family transcriptional regulator [Rothia sp. p3-SID1597]RUQ20647.1 TetR/AcrR family transcriptional regulator [Kocuria sp. HSID16901]